MDHGQFGEPAIDGDDDDDVIKFVSARDITLAISPLDGVSTAAPVGGLSHDKR
jgi:hypothetical protein